MPRRIIALVYFAILISENQPESLSRSSSVEYSLEKSTELIIPEIVSVSTSGRNNLQGIFKDFRTTNKISPEIFRDDFNIHVEKIGQPTSELIFKAVDFHNTPLFKKNKTRPKKIKKHLPVFRDNTFNTSRFNKTIRTNHINKKHRKLKIHTPETKSIRSGRITRIPLDDFEPDADESLEPAQDMSDELDLSNAKFLLTMDKPRKSIKNIKLNTSQEEVARDRENKHPKLDKHRQLRDYSNKIHQKKFSVPFDDKTYSTARHIEPQSDTGLQQTKILSNEKQNKEKSKLDKHRQRKKSNHTQNKSKHRKESQEIPINNNKHIQPQLDIALQKTQLLWDEEQHHEKNTNGFTTHYTLPEPKSNITGVVGLAKITKRIKVNNNESKLRNDEFTLTISDINDGPRKINTNNKYSHQPSLLLDNYGNDYQTKLKEKPRDGLSIPIVFPQRQDIKRNTLQFKNLPAPSPQYFEMKMKNKNESNLNHYDNLFNHEAKGNSNYTGDKFIKTIEDSLFQNTPTPNSTDVRLDTHHKLNVGELELPKIDKKSFDIPLRLNVMHIKSTMVYPTTSKSKQIDQDYSKVEILLNDTSDKSTDSKEEKHMLRYINDSNVSIGDDASNLHRTFRFPRGAKRKKLRRCFVACREAYTKVCRRVRCSPKAKRDLSYQCKRSCLTYFD